MQIIIRILPIFCCSFFTLLFVAQPTLSHAQTDIRPLLRQLTNEQKIKVLEYIRTLGADLDKEIQQTYEQVNTEKRTQAVQYMNLLLNDGKEVPQTTVSWNRDTLYFGQVEEGTILIDSFIVTNTGVYPYTIHSVKSSCDCTVLHYPSYPIMPGQSATIRIEFDSHSKAGRTRPGIILYDNSAPNKRNIIYLDGEVIPKKKARSMSGN